MELSVDTTSIPSVYRHSHISQYHKRVDPHTQQSHFLAPSYRHTPNTGNMTHIQDVPQLASTRLETQRTRRAE